MKTERVFISPHFCLENLPSKFLPCKLTLWGEEVKTLANFKHIAIKSWQIEIQRLQMEIVRHRFSPMQASGWLSDEQEPLQEWIYISNIYGDMLASPNGLFGFLPTFYPQKSSILTEVVGEDKKTLTVFSSLTKIL